MAKYGHFLFREHKIPCVIHTERRKNARCSFGKEHVIMRLPKFMSKHEKEGQMQKFISWASKQLEEKPSLLDQYTGSSYESGDILEVLGVSFIFDINSASRKTSSAKIQPDQTITMQLSDTISEFAVAKTIRTLTSRVLASYFQPEIEERVLRFNQRHFQENIKSVRLKYNTSNWGSCSSSNNINLSTRLLLTPDEVIDYVIIHELSHLKEMNHSKKFWSWVKKACPDYRRHEEHLRLHGSEYNFK